MVPDFDMEERQEPRATVQGGQESPPGSAARSLAEGARRWWQGQGGQTEGSQRNFLQEKSHFLDAAS